MSGEQKQKEDPFLHRGRERLSKIKLENLDDLRASIQGMKINANDNVDYAIITTIDVDKKHTVFSLLIDDNQHIPTLIRPNIRTMNEWIRLIGQYPLAQDNPFLTLLRNTLREMINTKFMTPTESVMFSQMLGFAGNTEQLILQELKTWHMTFSPDQDVVELSRDKTALCFWRAQVTRGRSNLRRLAQSLCLVHMARRSLFEAVIECMDRHYILKQVLNQLRVKEGADDMSPFVYMTTQLESLHP